MIQSIKQEHPLPAGKIRGKSDQIVEYMQHWLRSGQLAVGDRLPPERELSARLGVSLQTVNKAMARLEDAQLVSRSAGRGTFVTRLLAQDGVAVICDFKHLSSPRHAPSNDVLIETLMAASRARGLSPQFLIAKGSDPASYLASLGPGSASWGGVKGILSYGWKAGVEEHFMASGKPVVTVSSTDQGCQTVHLDYEELGRQAAACLLPGRPRRLGVLHNEGFRDTPFNNPLGPCRERLAAGGFDLAQLFLVPIDPRADEFAPDLIARLAPLLSACDGLFVTDENIAAALAATLAAGRLALPASIPVVTQATKGVELGLPAGFARLAFDFREVAETALDLLAGLLAGELNPEERHRLWVKPQPWPQVAEGQG